jgi:ATP-dependent DNA helicase DinG
VQRLHEWAARTETGDRDELVPGVTEQAWRQVAVTAGSASAPSAARSAPSALPSGRVTRRASADIVVTNHALLAIDAMEDFDVFPEHDVVIIDEAHDLVDRVTSVASDELSARRRRSPPAAAARWPRRRLIARLRDAAEDAGRVLAVLPAGRIDVLATDLALPLASLRDAAAAAPLTCAPALRTPKKSQNGSLRAGRLSSPLTSCGVRPKGSSARSATTSPNVPTWCGWTGQCRRSRHARRRCG